MSTGRPTSDPNQKPLDSGSPGQPNRPEVADSGQASAIAVLVLGAANPIFWGAWAVISVLLWGGFACQLAYRKLTVKYQLTNQRFVHETGLLKRITDRIEVIDIDDVSVEQRLIERMVGVGTIKLVSSDRSHPVLMMRGIENVKDVAAKIDDLRRKERRRRGLHIESI